MIGKTLVTALVVSVGLLAAGQARADYPEKPIKLIVPYKAGGGTDSLARTIQAAIEKHKLMDHPLVVVNTTGAGGVIGARALKDAGPDGYTFLQMHNEILTLSATGRLGFDPLQALAPVAQTTQSCLYLAVPAASPHQSFEDVIAAGKADPGKIKFADVIGGITHFTVASIMQASDVKFGIVQTGGTSARFASMKGGHTDMAFMSPGWIERGGDDLRGLLWMGPTKPDVAKDMPGAKDAGLDVTACLERRFWAPAGTPQERIDAFADVLRKVLETPELKAYHAKRLSDIRFRTGDDLKADLDREVAEIAKGVDAVKASMK